MPQRKLDLCVGPAVATMLHALISRWISEIDNTTDSECTRVGGLIREHEVGVRRFRIKPQYTRFQPIGP